MFKLYCCRIFELKIKFSFYDLPCSFPIKHSVVLLFNYFSLLKVVCPFHARSQMHKFARSIVLHERERASLGPRFVFFSLCALNARIPDAATVKFLIDQNFWAHHILQLRNKGQTERHTTKCNTMTS